MKVLLELSGWYKETIISDDAWHRRTVEIELKPVETQLVPQDVKPTCKTFTVYVFLFNGQYFKGLPVFTCK